MLKGFGRGQPGARGVDGGMGWCGCVVVEEERGRKGICGGAWWCGPVRYERRYGEQGRLFFLPAFDLRLVAMMRSAKGRGGKNRNTPLASLELLGLREVGGYSTGVNNGRIR